MRMYSNRSRDRGEEQHDREEQRRERVLVGVGIRDLALLEQCVGAQFERSGVLVGLQLVLRQREWARRGVGVLEGVER